MLNRQFVECGAGRWLARVVASLSLLSLATVAHAQFVPFVPAVGGVWIDPSGVIADASGQVNPQVITELRERIAADGQAASGARLRMVSLKGIEEALRQAAANGKPLPNDVRFLAGLQRIEYVLLCPDRNDIVLAGPADAWTIDDQGNVVGKTTGAPVIRLEDLIAALRTARAANEDYGITVSIEPDAQRRQDLHALYRRHGFSPDMVAAVEQTLGPQQVSLTGVDPTSRFAHILVIADFHMKRLAMGFETPAVEGMPSVLELASQRGDAPNQMSPRFWMQCSYEPLRRSEDGLSWQLVGPGVKTLTEESALASSGQGDNEAHPIAEQWARTMTEKFPELAAKDPIFGELRNLMDLAVVAALIERHAMLDEVGLEIPVIQGNEGNVELPALNVPTSVPTQCSFVRIDDNWLVTASGGVEVDSWAVVEQTTVDDQLDTIHAQAVTGDTDAAWWNALAAR
jgi:hypothetical protein